MFRSKRGSRPSWRVPESWVPRPELWLFAAIALGMLLVEVWQTSRMAQLCLDLDQKRTAVVQANARLSFMRAALDRHSTRAELAPVAAAMGLAPADARQVVLLPSEYLAEDRSITRDDDSISLLALAERVLGALVPEATARSRTGR